MNKTLLHTLFLTLIFLLSVVMPTIAQDNAVFTMTAVALQNGKKIGLDKLKWKYHSGDDLNWANPDLDDSGWETLNSTILTFDNLPKSGWNGIGWFRLRMKVDETLTNEQLALITDHWGASEIYVDGRLINQFGVVGASEETEEAYRPSGTPVPFTFSHDRDEHVIAVRRSVMTLRDPSSSWSKWINQMIWRPGEPRNPVGFRMILDKAENAVAEREGFLKFETGNRFGRGGLILMIGVLFLLIFIFYPSRRANLYFAIFAIFVMLNNFSNFLSSTSHYDLPFYALNNILFNISWVGFNIFLLLFLYTAFVERLPKYFYVFLAANTLYLLLVVFFTDSPFTGYLLLAMLFFVLVEPLRIIADALIKKKSGAWMVGLGTAMFGVLTLINIWLYIIQLFQTNIPLPDWLLLFARQISTLGVTLPIAIYLARSFAQANKDLEAQLVREVEHERDKARLLIVEAENERRAKELEEARQLQLSMLPRKLPDIPNLEIAAYMKPATEVGGDYYDFHVERIGTNGTLTVAVGDATGHGLKAGTVVAATKSLFANLAHEPEISETLKQMSRSLKTMNLRGLFMALTLLKFKENELLISAAGMPSALVYRAASKTVEEIGVRALPLGSVAKTRYTEQKISLSAGDVILLMSDGFPEMFNDKNEILGFEKAAEILPSIIANSPQEIINHLVRVGETWADGRPADDDVTFVVLKVKEPSIN